MADTLVMKVSLSYCVVAIAVEVREAVSGEW
jgi:hypothetical protein